MGMRTQAGFSVAKLIVIILICIGVIGGVIFAIYTINKNSHVDAASALMTDFITKVETKDPEDSYTLLSETVKTADKTSTYYAWIFWTTPFKEGAVKIDQASKATNYSNDSLFSLSADKAVTTFTYKTDANSSIYFTVKNENNTWVVSDYGTL